MTSMLGYEFMRNAFAASTVVSVVCGCIGYFLVLRREIFAGHALAHVAFPGATGAALLGLAPVFGLTFFTLAAGLGLSLLGHRAQRDVAIGVVLSFSLGLGLLFLHFYTGSAASTTSLLFGNVLGISRAAVLTLVVMSAVCLFVLGIMARPLLFASLQPDLAEARGVRIRLVSALFMIVVALAIAEAIQIVGVLLVFALLIAPAATAATLARTVAGGVVMSVAIALAVSWTSLTLSFHTDWPVSFWITALGTAAYLAGRVIRRGWR